jgi:hypothetical protein
MDDWDYRRPYPAVIGTFPEAVLRRPCYCGRGLRTTERAGAHSLQFGTYALWTAWLLAALAVRPVPSCIASLTRGVHDQAPNDVCLGQMPADVEYWIPLKTSPR